MTYIITALCLRDSSCVDVCPVECIIPGKPGNGMAWFYIDPDTCIDCGAWCQNVRMREFLKRMKCLLITLLKEENT
ncbi:MAG: hypothetical protein CM1200mP6_00590 [Anaerolineaceae bacterium]|nr:MAG: hypothetical protein CM1200mP6_00590 [Anaerolineaceae bacterium]